MESMGETKKRKSSRGTTDDDPPTNSGRKRCAEPLVDFLRGRGSRELHVATSDTNNWLNSSF